MSTATTTATAPLPGGADRRPGLGRLTRIELRKMLDTRSGFWLLLTTVLLTVLVVAILVIVGETQDQTLREMALVSIQPAAFLLPIIGILLVVQEWSQRTGQITFTLVPARGRVVAAKLLASLALALAAFAACLVLALIGTAVAGAAVDDRWSLPLWLVGQQWIYLGTGMITGFAIGALLLSPAPAIVLYFAAPTIFSILAQISVFEDAGKWLDVSQTTPQLAERALSSTEWAQAGTSLVLWMVIPLIGGLWRIRRAEIK